MADKTQSQVLFAIASIALGATAWLLVGPAPQPSPLVRVQVEPPQSPIALAELLDSPALVELEQQVHTARSDGEGTEDATAPHPIAMARETFEERFQRAKNSRMRSFILAPWIVRADTLVRDVALNPQDITLPAIEIELLKSIVDSHRAVAEAVHNARSHEAHRMALVLMGDEGVLSVDALLPRLPEDVIAEIDELATIEGMPGSAKYQQARSQLEAAAVRRAFGGDATVFHRGHAYLAPEGSIHPRLSEFDEFLRVRGMLMASDVMTVFLRNGALTTSQISDLLTALEQAATAPVASGG